MRTIFGLLLTVICLSASLIAAQPMHNMPPIWRNDEGPGDLGKVYYQTHEFCTAVTVDSVPLRVSEFSTRKSDKDAAFENLRATGFFDSTGANIQAVVPQGSLVVLPEESREEYRKVEVISQAHFYPMDLVSHTQEGNASHPLAKINELGYLHRDSLEDIRHYLFILRPSEFTKAAQAHGLDLEDASLRVSKTKKKINTLNCCVGKKCEQFIVFNIKRPDDRLGARRIAISPRIAGLLSTATAQPIEGKEEEEPREEEADNKKANTKIAPAPYRPVPSGSLDGAAPKTDIKSAGSIAGVPITGETPDKAICVASGRVTVRSLDKNGNIDGKTQFKVKNGEALRIRQGFDGAKKSFTADGQTHLMIEVDFTGLKKRGWVAEQFVKSESACKTAKQTAEEIQRKIEDSAAVTGALISGGVFPTFKAPIHPYTKGNASRWYGAGRDCKWQGKGKKRVRVCARSHAACDLFRKQGDPARAILDGTVIQGPYDFYEGTWAVEIKHSDGKIVRYGEISGKIAAGIRANAKVKQGQTVGYIKTVNSGCCDPMLHFEMYSGKGSGPLTQRWRKGFQRRSDLEDPTAVLRKLEKATFGKNG